MKITIYSHKELEETDNTATIIGTDADSSTEDDAFNDITQSGRKIDAWYGYGSSDEDEDRKKIG